MTFSTVFLVKCWIFKVLVMYYFDLKVSYFLKNQVILWYEPQASNIQPWSKITMRFTDAIIFNMNLNEPKPRQADPSNASFMFVSYTNRNISGSC
jgi:hypothetical protein